ncbi:MAG TPA: hypothetical protein PKK99_08195, partial [Bacteroidia bacterium]|nr:hypothetical protein [Bacteroidia bacterium]
VPSNFFWMNNVIRKHTNQIQIAWKLHNNKINVNCANFSEPSKSSYESMLARNTVTQNKGKQATNFLKRINRCNMAI